MYLFISKFIRISPVAYILGFLFSCKKIFQKTQPIAYFCDYDFYYKTSEKEEWIILSKDVDASILSTKEAGGFVGSCLAMYVFVNQFSNLK